LNFQKSLSMHKSILVLEESAMVHDLFESALPQEYWDWHIEHESFPENYVDHAKDALPGIIFLSNRDQKNDYAVVKEIRSTQQLQNTPILLLTLARDKLDEKLLRSLGIQGFLRKPFESATLLEQIEVTLQNHNRQFQKNERNVLENVDVIDDELLGLLSSRTSPNVSIDKLEEELDPTLQLHPIEAESMLLDDDDDLQDLYDTLSESDEGDVELPFDADEFDVENEEDEFYSLEADQAETEAIELELEEISLDIDEVEPGMADGPASEAPFNSASDGKGLLEVSVSTEFQETVGDPVVNVSRDGEIGLMEVEVVPYESGGMMEDSADELEDNFYDSDLQPLSDGDAEQITELKVTFSGSVPPSESGSESVVENNAVAGDSNLPYTELEITPCNDEDIIVIEHAEINDDLNDDYEIIYDEDFDDSELLDISIEGIDTEEDESLMETDAIDEAAIEESMEEVDLMSDTIEDLDMELDDEVNALTIEDDPFLDNDYDSPDEELVAGHLDEDSPLSEDSDEGFDPVEDDDDPSSILISNVDESSDPDFEDDGDLQEVEGIDDLRDFEPDFSESDPVVVEQDEAENLEIDFEGSDVNYSDDEAEQLLEELEGLDSENAQMNIQEMINFRQVMKAKYDIPENGLSEIDEDGGEDDLEIDFLSDDEIEDFDLAEESETDEVSAMFEDESLEEEDEIDIFAEIEDDDIAEVDLFTEDDDASDDLSVDDTDLYISDEETLSDDFIIDDTDMEENTLLEADEMLLDEDDADLEDLEDDPFSDATELEGVDNQPETEELRDPLTEPPMMMEEEARDNIPQETASESDEIDLLSDDLELDTDFSQEEDSTEVEEDTVSSPDDPALEENGDLVTSSPEDIEDNISMLGESETEVDEDFFFDDDIEEDDSLDRLEEDGDSADEDLFSDDDTAEDDSLDLLEEDGDSADEDLFSSDITNEDDSLDLMEEEDDSTDEDLFTDSGDEDSFEEIELSEMDTEDPMSLEEIFEPDTAPDEQSVDMKAISEAEEVAIEVPQDVFEMSDFKMTDLGEDIGTKSEATLDEPSVDESIQLEEVELTEDIDLPSMDEDLPDLSTDFDPGDQDDDLLLEMEDGAPLEELIEAEADSVDSIGEDIEILQTENDFESFPGESDTIGFTDDPATSPAQLADPKVPSEGKKKPQSLSPDMRDKLSGMIENVISETIQNTLHDMLPDMMDKIIQEELED